MSRFLIYNVLPDYLLESPMQKMLTTAAECGVGVKGPSIRGVWGVFEGRTFGVTQLDYNV